MFRLMSRVRFPPLWPPRGVDPATPRQKLSPTPYAIENLSRTDCFTVEDDLHVGPGKWSQVYSGILASESLGKLSNVVLKVFSPSLFPYPGSGTASAWQSEPDLYSPNSYRYTDELMAWAEVHAYSTLSSLQGVVIPNFIDAFMVQPPGSEDEMLAIVVSRINGQSFNERCIELGSEIDDGTAWYPLAMEVFRKVYAIHELGISGLDVRGPNILIADSKSPTVMLFDFAFSRPNDYLTTKQDNKPRKLNFVTKTDLFDLATLLATICGSAMGRPGGSLAGTGYRRWAFLEWARENHAHEPWVAAWWDPFFHKLKQSKRKVAVEVV